MVGRRRSSLIYLAATVVVFTKCALGSHFRGASFSWKPFNSSSTTDKRVIISFRIAWRRSFNGDTYCDQSTINAGTLIGPSGGFNCQQGCSGTITSMQFKCTDFSVQEDWSAGSRNKTYAFPDRNPPLYQASFQGNAWIGLVTGGGAWEVRMYVNLTKRNDTRRVNTSPVTAMSPIVRLQHGCNHSLVIPVNDVDKDDIRCRWAESSKSECGGVCRTFPGAKLDERKCVISYSATGSTGWYGVAIMVEDFSTRLAREPLSGIPLQFLVNVFSSSEKCANKPEFTSNTRVAGSCIGVPYGLTFREPFIATAHGSGNRIVEIKTISPSGLTKSRLAQFSASEWYVNITWTPSRAQIDPVIFCYTAIDFKGLSSPQSCLTFLAGVKPPYLINGSQTPTGLIYPDHDKWSLKFDKEFVRPQRSRYIRIYHSSGTEVQRVDVSTSYNLIYPAGSLGRVLEYKPSFKFVEKQIYYILLDPGIVQGTKFCGPESPPMRDAYFWRVKIRDVTAPKVTFILTPVLTNATATVTWSIDEPASTVCSVTTPVTTFIQACNGSYTGTKLSEGFYRITITATDLAGNIALPVSHSWNVDLTPPEPYLTTKPLASSKETSFKFQFGCRKDNPCFYECSVEEEHVAPAYSRCYETGYTATNLKNNVSYVFWLKSQDKVGNKAPVLKYKWKIDTEPPAISKAGPINIQCTSDMSPSAIGKPVVTDNDDPLPTLAFKDLNLNPGCNIQRVWTATDRAGNIAQVTQTINIISVSPPVIKYTDNIVVACQTIKMMNVEIRKTVNVTHPCDIPTNLTYRDSLASIRCSSAFTRTWTATDTCGSTKTSTQTIRVLQLQLPDYPKVAQVNVDLNQDLQWPQYPGAVTYKVFIWKNSDTKPLVPAGKTSSRTFSPSKQFPHGTKMLWQVEYILSSGQIIPGPVWGFVTKYYPDFKIDVITLPPHGFSGQTLSISWSVRNIGGIGNTAVSWEDRVFLSRTTSFSQSRLMKKVSQRRLLDPNDGYIGRTDIQLKDEDVGDFYVFVQTDAFRNVRDIDFSNNLKVSSSSVKISLTPPPNLKVTSIVIPANTFSGQSISVKWTVSNQGVGITGRSTWVDRLFFSKDNQLNKSDTSLGYRIHNGLLTVNQAYTETMSVNIPHAIFGDFYIIVMTDASNNVYENVGEKDNVVASKQPLKVVLAPPPDLVVSSITIQSSQLFSGRVATILYRVTNEGLGTPFHNWWSDRVSITSLETKSKTTISTPSFSGVLPAGSWYDRQIKFFVAPKFKTGRYTLSIHTDVNKQVFEYIYNNNNIKEREVRIVQTLPDLVVQNVNAYVTSDPEITNVYVNFTVRNLGQGKSYGAPWADKIFLSSSKTLSLKEAQNLGQVNRMSDILPDTFYIVISAKFQVPRESYGLFYVFVVTDFYSSVLEENKGNNNGHSTGIIVPRMLSNLVVKTFIFRGSSSVYAGSNVDITWTVQNHGNASTLDNSWIDQLFLSRSTSTTNAVKLREVSVRPRILPGQEYNVTTVVNVPENAYGEFFLVVNIDGYKMLKEADYTNNIAARRLIVRVRPLPNLQVLTVIHEFESSTKILLVRWKVKNIGYSMGKANSWTDSVLLSRTASTAGVVYSLGSKDISAELSTQQEYTASTSVKVPRGVFGTFYVQVQINSNRKLNESFQDRDNIKEALEPLIIDKIPSPQLDVKIETKFPSNSTCGEPLAFSYEVRNAGKVDADVDSWTDEVYSYNKANSDEDEVKNFGSRLSSRVHTGGLRVNDTYFTNVNVTLKCYLGSDVMYVYVFSDVNKRTGSKSSTTQQNSKGLNIVSGPLPDLEARFVNSSLRSQGGRPYKVDINITNTGTGPVRGDWFNALFLSQDVIRDPFDRKLTSQRTRVPLAAKSSAVIQVEIFLPYDIVSSDYYLLLELDSGNLVNEANENNNAAYVLIRIEETIRTDLLVSSVSTASTTVTLGSEIQIDWTIRNNGTQTASGYKCDSVYLSEDETWQIQDREIDQPKCGFISLLPYNNGMNKDVDSSLKNPLPLVPQGQYRGLVKSRSNIRDPIPRNNIKAGPKNINVTFPSLNLGSCVEADKGTSVYVIDDVPSEMTLIVSARLNAVNSLQDLYLRHKKPASSYLYDASSKFARSTNQDAVVTTTKKGRYYMMLKRTDRSPVPGIKSKVCAKLAKFEISRIVPSTFSALGNVTLRVEGTMFGWDLQVSLLTIGQNLTEIKALHVYRFSSILLYATFNVQSLSVGARFDIKITDQSSKLEAMLNNSLSVEEGIPGKLSISVQRPRAIRRDDTGDIIISYQNIGDTDLQSPALMFSATKMTLIRFVQDGRQPSQYDQLLTVIAQPLEGPGGILPPKSSGRLLFQTRHLEGGGLGKSELTLVSLLDHNEPHIFMQSKDELRPSHVSPELWEPVWRNFLNSVGTTQKSLNRRLSSMATLMSVNGRKVHLVKDLIDFQLKLADGSLSGSRLLDTVDLDDQSNSNLLTLQLERVYNPLLTTRRGKGIFGFGWSAPWWETFISHKNDTIAIIIFMRQEKIFRAEKSGIYVGDESGNIKVDGDELIATSIEKDSSEILVFDKQSKRLKAIRSLDASDENVTVSSYTSEGNPTLLKHSKGGSLSVEFNSQKLVRKAVLIKPSGEKIISLYAYDPNKPLLTSTTIQDKIQSYSYTDKHDIQYVTYPNGAKLSCSFNSDTGLLEEMVTLTSDGRKEKALKFQHDWNGLLKVTNKEDKSHVTYIFDEMGNVLSFAGSDGIPFRTESFVSETIAVRSLVQGDQTVEKRTLNTENKIMTVEDGNGDKVQFTMGNDGIPRNITDAAGSTFNLVYKNNKLMKSVFPDSTTDNFDYDDKGNLKKRTTRNGRDIQFEYREDGRLAKKSVPDVGPTYYLHDSEGNIVMATNNAGTVTLRYNRDNLPISVTYPDGSHIEYRYNKNGQRIGLYENSTGYNVSYHYDNNNRLSEVHTAGPEGAKALLKVHYDSSGNVFKNVLGNNASMEQSFYPGTKRRRKLINYLPNGKTSSMFEYKYDFKGRPVEIKSNDGQWSFKYDAASQLIGWSDVYNNGTKRSRVYDYDSRRNRIFTVDDGKRENYETNKVNQFTSAGDMQFVYDKNGNMVSRKNKNSRAKDVKYVFSEENVMMQAETANERCDYIYDSLGNLYKKKCTSGETRFIVDPFSNLGSNVIAQVSGGVSTLFVHTNEQGLLAQLNTNGTAIYYQFNGEGSVVNLIDDNGDILNTYLYDPFGLVLKAEEKVLNDFLFVGQWGVSRERNVPYLYRMRSRQYDALIGRFISYDPLGYRTLETNLYLYAYNNPLVLQDPQGRLPIILIGAGIGALGGAGAYAIGQWATGQKLTWGGAASAALTGAVVGATGGAASALGLPAGVGAYFMAKHAFFAGMAGYALKQKIDGKPFNGKEMMKEAATGAATAWIPIKLPIKRLPKAIKDLADSLFGGSLTNIATNFKKAWENAKKQLEKLGEKFKKWFKDFMDWVASRDPNDILGPAGYGDAKFIAGDSTLDYKIRFENDPNATAPAQRVFIRYKLDSDLDARSFRIGSFGFGNFTKVQKTSSPFIQEKLDFVNDRNLYVRVTAGIDIVQNEATWDLQSLDPKTGEPPRDPRRGFLPPNNGTTGQGYVTFSIQAKEDVKPLTRIDAVASIIFDVNEPIDTPPIFNTIDNSGPRTNLTVLQDVLRKGSLAVMVNKHDVGTGVQSVDIFYQEQQAGARAISSAKSDFKLLLQDVSEDIAVLPLSPGGSYKLATAAVDHVGNLQEVQAQQAIFVDFPEIKGSCLGLNNCSNRGNCSMFSLCICEQGFYGVDCSQDEPPLEPPLLAASSSVVSEDTPIPVFLSASLAGDNITIDTSLTITIYGVPDFFTFSRGMRSKDRVVLRHQEFGDMFVNPSRDFSGNVTLKIAAEVKRGSQTSFTNSSLTLTVNAKADLPNLVTKRACANSKGDIPLSINCSLQDLDGSERLTIGLSGLPTGYQLSPLLKQENGINYIKPELLSEVFVRYEGKFKPFVLMVVATSVEISNGDNATQIKFINVTACITEFTCAGVNNCSGHGTCIAENNCTCDEDFEGRDCSEGSGIDSNTDRNKANVAAIVGGTIGGLVFVVLAVLLVVFLVKARHKDKHGKSRSGTTANVYNNPIFEEQ